MSWVTMSLQIKEVHKCSICIILSFKTNFNGTAPTILVTDSLLPKVLIDILSYLKACNFNYFHSLSLTNFVDYHNQKVSGHCLIFFCRHQI